ncbi:hypothetical protein QWZ08_24810 [Ferruginibacter paludis]|uniref:hypothetical protein n=1 Tax=Ferruginibacter paludis TaxID=1310417 RepID=UPI0025B2CAA7|nr:hypothetical protein [Ferruginibacter paludis]MDN3658888.1 hypothetical protein [Ferruginibacter paludis]
MDNVAIPIRNMPFSFGTKRGLIRNEYELPERQLISNQLKSSDIVIEMGGSIGILTAIISKYVGPQGKIISVEASKRITDISKKWLQPKGNIEILTGFGFPVFSVNKKLKVDKFSEYGGSLGGVVSYSDAEADNSSNEKNEIWDIGKICTNFNIKPTVLVFDIEGTETILIDSQPNFPATVRIIMIELHPWMYDETSKNAIIERIQSEGFSIADIVTTSYLFTRK